MEPLPGELPSSAAKASDDDADPWNGPLHVDWLPWGEDETAAQADDAAAGFGRLGMCIHPGRVKPPRFARNLDHDLERLHTHYRVDVLVTMTETKEWAKQGFPDLPARVSAAGMRSIHHPVVDKWIPRSTASFCVLIDTIRAELAAGSVVVVHCHGGKGRTGTVATAVLMTYSPEMSRSLAQCRARVRAARPGTIKNPFQVAYLALFHRAWAAHRKRTLQQQQGSSESPVPELPATPPPPPPGNTDDGRDAVGSLPARTRRSASSSASRS